jgi:hypothetical protein
MASFTDQISQFNPYVQQLPIEAMVQVGMQKQAQYDQGVQKIQSYVDNIAGLDVIKPIHKEYLQSKLNQLGSRLKTVAAGDFSNAQLVNSIGGMTTQIVKDPTIQNAVYSTQKIRKVQSDMEAAKKAGKGAIENDWWANTQINSWINDGDAQTTFNGEYTEYIDIDKKLRDLAGKLKDSENSTDIPFKTDADGRILYYSPVKDAKGNVVKMNVSLDPKSGTPQIDDAMKRIKTKGVGAQQILNNFYDSLSENEKQQLKITGNYHYQGATKDTFKNDIVNTYNNAKKILSEQVVDWAVKLKTDNNLTDAQKDEIKANIANANAKLSDGTFENEIAKKTAEIDSIRDMSDYKYSLYTQKYLTNLAKDISNESKVVEIMNNPYFQADMEKQKLQFQVNRARQEHQEWAATHALSIARFQSEDEDRRYKRTQDEIKRRGLQPVTTPGGLGTDVKAPTLDDLNNDISATETAIKTLDASYANQLFPELSNKKTILSVTVKDGKTVTEYISERQSALNKLNSDYNINPKVIKDNAQREYVERRRAFDIDLAQKSNLFLNISNDSKKFDNVISDALKSEQGINFSNGKQLYSAEELFNVANTSRRFIKSSGGSEKLPGQAQTKYSFDSEGFMNQYKGTKYEPIANAYVKRMNNQPLTAVEQSMYNRATSIGVKYQPVLTDIVNQKFKYQSDELAKKMPERQVTIGTINMGNEVDKVRVENLIGNKFEEYTRNGQVDVQNKSLFDPTTIAALQKDSQTKYTIEKKYDGSANLILNNGKTRQVVPMNSSEFGAYFADYAVNSPADNFKYAIMASPNHTTNLSGTDDPVNAYITGHNIGGLAGTPLAGKTRLDVEGSPNNTGGANDKYQVRMYFNDNGIWRKAVLNQQGYVTEDGVLGILNNIGPATVQSLLKQK